MKTEIKQKITLVLDGKEIEISRSEAENLYNQLGAILNKPNFSSCEKYLFPNYSTIVTSPNPILNPSIIPDFPNYTTYC